MMKSFKIISSLLVAQSISVLLANANMIDRIDETPRFKIGQNYYTFTNSDGYTGVSRADGFEIIPAKYLSIFYVGENIFYADKGQDEKFLLDQSGKVLQKLPDWADAAQSRFRDGVINLSANNGRIAVYDRHGKNILKNFTYREVRDFHCGRAAVEYGNWEDWWSAYIDTNGKIVIGPFPNAMLEDFCDGVARIKLGSAVGLIDTKGNYLVVPNYDSISLEDGRYFGFKNNRRDELKVTPKTMAVQKNAENDIYLPIFANTPAPQPIGPAGATSNLSNSTLEQKSNCEFRTKWCSFNDRATLFAEFLSRNNLIGMNAATLSSFFGPLNIRETYPREHFDSLYVIDLPLQRSGCMRVGPQPFLQLGLDARKTVQSWRLNTDAADADPWIRENCRLIDPKGGLQLSNLIPKY